MRRKKSLNLVLTLIAVSFLFYLYSSSNDSLQINQDVNDENIEYIEINTSQVDRIFEDEVQNGLYLKQRRKSSTFKSSQKRVLFNTTKTSRNRRNSFYLITEYTPVFRTNKYCRLKKDEEFRRDYVKKRGSRYQLLEKVYETRTVNQPYDLLDKCAYKNCFFTCEHSLASHSDALLFHWSDLTEKVLALNQGDDYEKIYTSMFQFERPAKQVWILWDDEANKIDPILDKFKFNWTISYLSSSEASYCSYGCLVNM